MVRRPAQRHAEAAVVAGAGRHVGQRDTDGPTTTRRLFYVDWPLLDRHRERVVPQVERWLDVRSDSVTSITGDTLRRTAASLARQPFRTQPTFNTTVWGGHWGQQSLGVSLQAPNTALGYELIAPESGVLVGEPGQDVEIPLQVLVALHPREIMGDRVHEVFGCSFPIRFDYLDTLGGDNLSVHVHPEEQFMKYVFGWPYPQHETYYVMVATEGSQVFLGLRQDIDLTEFRRQAEVANQDGQPFDVLDYIQVFRAEPHQLFTIPAGTPHGSGTGNVVLEVSATPYLYSLRLYDWLRDDNQGDRRPVHVDHAFDNLDLDRSGRAVADQFVQAPRTMRAGPGWVEEVLSALPEMFFEVHRLVVEPAATLPAATDGRFHVLNVVAGQAVSVAFAGGVHRLNYAETLIIPAAVGDYTVRAEGALPVRVVKAMVR